MRILLVEDDEDTVLSLTQALTAQHYLVSATPDGQTALNLAADDTYDLILLDVVLPGLDGISLCRQLRSSGYQMPILMVTVRDRRSDRILGLEAGADDYVTKPFDLSELIARIRALLRRSRATLPDLLTWGDLQLNPDGAEVRYGNTLIRLTPKEYGLLELFLRHPGRIFSRNALLDRVWKLDRFPGDRAVNTQIKGLRQKLKEAGLSEDPIETLYGLGYRLKPNPTSDPAASRPSSPPLGSTDSNAAGAVLADVATIWTSNRGRLLEELAVFQQAIAQLATGTLDPRLQQQAQALSHRLAGSLGSFNMPSGSAIARSIEALLQTSLTQNLESVQQLTAWVKQLEQLVERGPSPPDQPQPEPDITATGYLLVIDDDPTFTQQIQTLSPAWGVQIALETTLSGARAAIARSRPDLILLDLGLIENSDATRAAAGTNDTSLSLLTDLTSQPIAPPVLALSRRNHLSDRIAVARLGGVAFLQKPVMPEQLFRAITQALNRNRDMDARVMVVDDDPGVLGMLASCLEPWGTQVITLNDPQQFWEVLEATVPDLLILDVELPDFSGLELCQVVRNDPRWSDLPILFLSAHTDSTTIRQVFTVGGDDYISKPVVDAELIARVLNRLERVRMRRYLDDYYRG